MLEASQRLAEEQSERRAVAALRPEDVFMVWLIGLPRGADVPHAAREEIAKIDRASSSHVGVSRLRDLFAQAAGLQPRDVPLPAQ